MSILSRLSGTSAGVTGDTLGQAQAASGTDRIIGFQPGNTAAPNTLVATSPSQIAQYAANNAPYVATIAATAGSVSPQLLDRTNHGKTLQTVADTTISAPATLGNLGGDGYRMTLLNPGGFTITLASNGGNAIISNGVTTTTALVVTFFSTIVGGTQQIIAGIPGIASTTPALVYASISSVQPATAATVTYNFVNGLPATPMLLVDGSAVSATPTINTASGTGTTARGTVVFAFTTPAAGTHTLSATSSGTYAAVSVGTALSFAVTASLTITTQPSTASNVGNVTISGTYTGSAMTGFAYAWSNSGGSGTVPTFTATGGAWSTTFPTAAVLGAETVTITGTGPNTSSATSAAITVAAPQPFAVTAIAPQAIGNVTVGSVMLVSYTGTWAVPTVTVDGGAVTPTANSAGSGGVGTITLPINATSGRHAVIAQGTSGGTAATEYFLNAGATNPFSAQYLYTNTYSGTAAAYTFQNADNVYPIQTSVSAERGLLFSSSTFSPDANHTSVSTLQSLYCGNTRSPVVPPPLTITNNGGTQTQNYYLMTIASGGSFGTYYANGHMASYYTPGLVYSSLVLTDSAGGQWLLVSSTYGTGT